MSEIKSVEELRAVADGTVLLDNNDDAWQCDGNGQFERAGDKWPHWAEEMVNDGPFTVIYVPNVGATRAMTKCCAQGCPNTAALQPGSSYLCPDHGDGGCSDQTITKGDHS